MGVFASAPVKQRISADHLRVLVSTPTSTPIRVLLECVIFTIVVQIGFKSCPNYTELHTIYSRLRLQVLFPARGALDFQELQTFIPIPYRNGVREIIDSRPEFYAYRMKVGETITFRR